MPITNPVMSCTWYLKKRLGIRFKWALKTSMELCSLDEDWSRIIKTPGGIFYPWSYSNTRGFISFLNSLASKVSMEDDVEGIKLKESIDIINGYLLDGTRVSAQEICPLMQGELVYLVSSYYVASIQFKDSNELPSDYDIFAPLPRWFFDS